MIRIDTEITNGIQIANSGLVDAGGALTGGVIGSGIFLVPASIAGQLPHFSEVMLMWVVGGALTVFGALSMAELGAMFPGAGGIYIYLREIYGRPMAFMYGWGLLAMIHSGSVATLASGFSVYVGQLFGLSAPGQKATGVIAVAALTWLNSLGIRTGKLTTNTITVAKLGGLAAMIGAFIYAELASLRAELARTEEEARRALAHSATLAQRCLHAEKTSALAAACSEPEAAHLQRRRARLSLQRRLLAERAIEREGGLDHRGVERAQRCEARHRGTPGGFG